MIPQELRNHNNEQFVENLVQQQQSPKVEYRIKAKSDTYSQCKLCLRKDILIWSYKYWLCKRCFMWCKAFIGRRYGRYAAIYMGDAFNQFNKPIECKFFDKCGNYIPRISTDGSTIRMNRKTICPECYPIYKAGYDDAWNNIRNRKLNSIKQRDMQDAIKYKPT